jgi:putative ABC transport system substrate-binding protein
VFEASIPSKWLDLLKEIAPDFKRVAFMFNPDTAPYINSFLMPSFEAAAGAFKVAQSVAPVHSDAEIEAVIISLGREPRGVLLVGPDNFMDIHHSSIISLAARNNVPAIYYSPVSARDGGLISYGADFQKIPGARPEKKEFSNGQGDPKSRRMRELNAQAPHDRRGLFGP